MQHRIISKAAIAILAAMLAHGAPAHAQQQPAAKLPSPEVGTMAPDFTLPGATRYGVLRDPVRLSDLRGKTVVLAFFFKARTKG